MSTNQTISLIKQLSQIQEPEMLHKAISLLHQEVQSGNLDETSLGDALQQLYQKSSDISLCTEIKRLQNRLRNRKILGRDLLRLSSPPLGDSERLALWKDLHALKGSYDGIVAESQSFEETYEVLEKIGDGGMSVVFRARRLTDGSDVAIKFLRRKYFSSPAVKARFRRECRVSMELRDPTIVRVFEAGEYEGGGFLVMEYLPLGGVDGLLHDPGLTSIVSFLIAIQVAEALAVIHKRNIVHRDVKLSNLLIESWNQDSADIKVRLSDFGICKELAAEGLTRTGSTLGTDFYIAPEQLATPAEVDSRADIYSLGVLIYRLFSKKYFPTGEYQDLKQLDPTLPEELDLLVKKCLQQAPEHRPESAELVAQELRALEKMNAER